MLIMTTTWCPCFNYPREAGGTGVHSDVYWAISVLVRTFFSKKFGQFFIQHAHIWLVTLPRLGCGERARAFSKPTLIMRKCGCHICELGVFAQQQRNGGLTTRRRTSGSPSGRPPERWLPRSEAIVAVQNIHISPGRGQSEEFPKFLRKKCAYQN